MAEIRPEKKYQIRIFSGIVIIITIFVLIFVPTDFVNLITNKINQLADIIVVLGLDIALIFVVSTWVFSTSDILFTGKSKYSIYFQSNLPSGHLMEKLNCSQGEANDIWFSIFNKWKNDKNPRHEFWKRTFERGYGCRLIFHLRNTILFIMILSTVFFIAYESYYFFIKNEIIIASNTELLKIGMLIIELFLLWYLNYNNQIPGKRNNRPTGCWYRWKEINDIHKAWLDNNILSKAKNYNQAIKLV